MLYCATNGFEVGAIVVNDGVKLPDPQPSDASVNRMQADEHTTTRKFFIRTSLLFVKSPALIVKIY
jgi:hypothetical protein